DGGEVSLDNVANRLAPRGAGLIFPHGAAVLQNLRNVRAYPDAGAVAFAGDCCRILRLAVSTQDRLALLAPPGDAVAERRHLVVRQALDEALHSVAVAGQVEDEPDGRSSLGNQLELAVALADPRRYLVGEDLFAVAGLRNLLLPRSAVPLRLAGAL